MNPFIRLAQPGDAAELARLLSPLGYPLVAEDVRERWSAWTDEGNEGLVADDGARGLTGVVTLHTMRVLHRPQPVGRITSLAVDTAARGRGTGRRLLTAAHARFRERGCGVVEVTSHMRRAEAHAFYLHMGYDQTSYRFAVELQ